MCVGVCGVCGGECIVCGVWRCVYECVEVYTLCV